MKVTKLGHCCLLLEHKGVRILTDPGDFTISEQGSIKDIDLVLITHEHGDHLHVDSLEQLIKNNPDVKVISNSSVGKILEEKGVICEIVEKRQSATFKKLLIEAFDHKHAEIFEEFGQVQNTGYFIDNIFFFPGDAYCNPEKPIDILALPVAGPWSKISDAMAYALAVKPRICFPVHDGALARAGGSHRVPELLLPKEGIDFTVLEINKETEL